MRLKRIAVETPSRFNYSKQSFIICSYFWATYVCTPELTVGTAKHSCCSLFLAYRRPLEFLSWRQHTHNRRSSSQVWICCTHCWALPTNYLTFSLSRLSSINLKIPRLHILKLFFFFSSELLVSGCSASWRGVVQQNWSAHWLGQ